MRQLPGSIEYAVSQSDRDLIVAKHDALTSNNDCICIQYYHFWGGIKGEMMGGTQVRDVRQILFCQQILQQRELLRISPDISGCQQRCFKLYAGCRWQVILRTQQGIPGACHAGIT